ncbi:MAG: BMC domain-containing protein [Acidobacteriota bacterium]
MHPAILLLEFDSIAVGIDAGDAMAKRATLTSLHAGSVQPGKYLVLAGGEVAEVEEARTAGRERARTALVDELYLPEVHSEVVAALTGGRRPSHGEALGIIETKTVSAVIAAADVGVKAAEVAILEIRMADGLGGKGYVLFSGQLHDVEAAVAHAEAAVRPRDQLIERVVIPKLHREMLENLSTSPEFGARVRSSSGQD